MPGAGTARTPPPNVPRVTRRTGPAGALALAALVLAGCGQGPGARSVVTTPPSAFVDAVKQLVQPAERMGVVAVAALRPDGPQPSPVEVDGLVGDAARELREFRALRPGDPALAAEQRRLVAAFTPIVQRMRAVQAILRADARAGLSGATSALLTALEGIPSAARS